MKIWECGWDGERLQWWEGEIVTGWDSWKRWDNEKYEYMKEWGSDENDKVVKVWVDEGVK